MEKIVSVALNNKIVTSSTGEKINQGSYFLSGGNMSEIVGHIRNLYLSESRKGEEYGYWISFKLRGKSQTMLFINIHRIPKTSSKSLYIVKHQYDLKSGKTRITKFYRTKISHSH